MSPRLAHRIAVVRAILSTPWRVAFGLFGAIAAYDTALSQFVPEGLAKRAPKAWQVAVLTGGLVPFWAWAVFLALLFAIASLEYAVRRTIRPYRQDEISAQTETAPVAKASPPVIPAAPEPIFDGFNIAEGKSVRMSAREFVYFVANQTSFGRGMADAMGGVDGLLTHPARYIEVAFQRVAQNGGIEVIGRKNGVGEHELIPSTFWYSSTIDQTSVNDGNTMGKTHPAASERGGLPIAEKVPVYTDLWLKRADVYRAWQSGNFA